MNLWDRAKQIKHGIEVISEWLGDGGQVVDQETAQKRANICLKCPLNVPTVVVVDAVARAIKKHLSVKNELALRVEGEKSLHTCQACGCVLRLLVWEPQSRVKVNMTPEETEKTPSHCWKLE